MRRHRFQSRNWSGLSCVDCSTTTDSLSGPPLRFQLRRPLQRPLRPLPLLPPLPPLPPLASPATSPAPPTSPSKAQCSLEAGQHLYPNQSIQSTNNRFIVIFQPDGNLVLYEKKPTGMVAEWATMTLGQPVGFCVMQDDGNLVIYSPRDPPYKAIWSTSTNGQKNVTATIQDDGNFVLNSKDGDGKATAVWNAWDNHPISLPHQ